MPDKVLKTKLDFDGLVRCVKDLNNQNNQIEVNYSQAQKSIYLVRSPRRSTMLNIPYYLNLPTTQIRIDKYDDKIIVTNETKLISIIIALMLILLIWSLIIGFAVTYVDLRTLWFYAMGIASTTLIIYLILLEYRFTNLIMNLLEECIRRENVM